MTETSTERVQYELDDGVALVRMDDGKANAISHEMAGDLDALLDRAQADGARALVLAGRSGRFCAGFHLPTMQSGVEEARDLLRVGGEFALRLYTLPIPTVVAVSGHALAMGAILLMTADLRVGAAGDFKIGLNEVRIGMPVPRFVTVLAEDRLSRRHLDRATSLATIYDPPGAAEAGFLDQVVEADTVDDVAMQHARAFAADFHPQAFAATREHRRADVARRVHDALASDLERFTVATA